MIRWRRWLWAVPALAVLWTLAGWALPPLLKSQAESRLSSLLGRAVSVGEVSFSPWALKLGVSNLAIAAASAASSAEPLLRVARIEIDAAASSLLRLAPVIESVQIDAPRLHLTRTADGHYDIDDLLARLAPKPEAKPAEPARFALYNLSLRDGEVLFDDVPVKRRHRVSALQVALPFISNQPSQVEVKVEPRIAFALNGTAFDSAATATPFASNHAGVMSLRIKPLDLAPYLGYLPATLPVAVRGGRVAADLSLAFAAPAGAAPQMSLKGSVEAGDLVVTERGGEPLLDVKRLTLGLSDIQPLARKLALGRLELDGLRLTLARNAKGEINLARLAPAAAPAASAPAAAAQPAWQLSLDALELGNARVLWNDATTQPAAALMLDDIKLSLRQLRQPSVAPSPLTLSAVLKTAAKADRLNRNCGRNTMRRWPPRHAPNFVYAISWCSPRSWRTSWLRACKRARALRSWLPRSLRMRNPSLAVAILAGCRRPARCRRLSSRLC